MRAVLLVAVLLSGCASVQPALDKASEVADTEVQVSLFMICRGARVGAIAREFSTPEKARLWLDLCQSAGAFSPAEQ